MNQTILYAEHISKSYKGKKSKKTIALDDLTFELKKGEIHSLLGPNGAGKTTLIKILATLLAKDEGTVNIMGYDLDESEKSIRHILGYVGQDTERSAYARLTARENLHFFGSMRGLSKEEIDKQIDKLVTYLGFEENMSKQFMHLSGGQKQIVVLMRALLHSPPIIFLDEPTKGLDPIIAQKIRKFLMDMVKKEGRTLLLTSHILSEVDEISDRVSLIHKGKIAITDTPDALKASVGVTDFIELERNGMSIDVLNRIKNLDVVISHVEHNEWDSFGVSDPFDGTQEILGILKETNSRVRFRHKSVSLEDAFIHHIGMLEESFDK